VLSKSGRIAGRESVKALDENITTARVLNIYQSVLARNEAPATSNNSNAGAVMAGSS
jgi:hypothetical protein